MDKVIDTIITDTYKFSRNIYNRLIQGAPPGNELFTQTRHYSDCTVFIRVQYFSVEKKLYSIFLQIRTCGLIITVDFLCNITLKNLKKLVRKKLISEREDVKNKMKTLDNLIEGLE